MSTFQTFQEIYAGAAQLMVTSVATNNIDDATTTQIDQSASPSGYTSVATALVCDDASAIAPDVWETSAGSIGDPPVIDVIGVVRTGEIMFCYSRTDSSETINVIRGAGKHWQFYSRDDTQYNAAINDDDYLQLLGTFTFPSRDNLVLTSPNSSVIITESQDVMTTVDSYKGNDTTYTSAPPSLVLTCTLPRNTTPTTMSTLGFQRITDGNTSSGYFRDMAAYASGTKLPAKFIVVVPNDVLSDLPVVSVGGSNHLNIDKCYILPYAQLNPTLTHERGQGSQLEYDMTFNCNYDRVCNFAGRHGKVNDLCRISEVIA